jgi:bifunctional non-homologous end joining protein LigD
LQERWLSKCILHGERSAFGHAKTVPLRHAVGWAAGVNPPSLTEKAEVVLAGRRLTLSHLDKVFYPEVQFTKGQVIEYYLQVSPVLLPHLRNRPLTLKRYPDGVNGGFFYEKRCPSFRPTWLKTAPVWSEGNRSHVSYCLANDAPSLVWAANLADLELHTSLARFPKVDRPTTMVFDLDPGEGAEILQCADVAIRLRAALERHGLKSFPKTSGSKGMQLYVPLNTAVTFDQTKEFARNLAETLEREHPDTIVSQMAKRLRKGKVFIDWSQNDDHKTTVCVYSLRARQRPTVSTPLKWAEVEKALKARSSEALFFEAHDVLRRVEKQGDLFEPVLKLKQKLPRKS